MFLFKESFFSPFLSLAFECIAVLLPEGMLWSSLRLMVKKKKKKRLFFFFFFFLLQELDGDRGGREEAGVSPKVFLCVYV